MNITMKQLFIASITFASFTLQAQNNVFLERSYWKKNPDVTQIKAEIAKGSNPSQLNANAFDPVVFAIVEDTANDAVKFLLEQKGNDVNKLTHDGRTYIFWAAYRGNTDLMEYLLARGAKTNVLDDHGYTYLNFAAANGQSNTKVYDLALKNGANLKKDLDHDGANALLLIAPHDKDFTLINYFIGKGLDIKSTDANGNTAFNYAARTGNITTLKRLLEKGVTFNDNAMIFASQGTRSTANTLELYQYLESLKIKPTAVSKNGQNALHAIVRKDKQEDIIKYFIEKGVDINQADHDGTTAFMNAAMANSDVAVINLLAASVKNINQVNKKGISALALAVRSNTPEVVRLLIQKGADVNVADANGDNLAYYLIQSYNPQKAEAFEAKLKALEEKGFKVATPQKNGNTLYHLAVAKNDLSLIKLVERYKVDVNAKNKEGMTALHKAAMTAQDATILKHLMALGAKKDAVTEFKETAYDLASENEALTKNKIAIDFLK
ncbi:MULTISPECIES: ankyrin repeat domain-containing protein [unclassified Flavobacterium]|uniref:ankyrin repeat domain-containing protein n=1 Tax=unclassified Flavobacterium TaxID=196869 RepID=UPI000A904F5C|nr:MULTISPECIES: ankyrin repeat domain-containing protein [unclassified Flavobacterium]